MQILKKVLIVIYYFLVLYLPNFFRELFLLKDRDKSIAVKSYLNFKWGKWKCQNWGDDMNVFLCELWFGKTLINYATSILSWQSKKPNYALIGSILQTANKNTIVWGSGLISRNEVPKEQPKKICAVRGPLSREVLLNKGFSCPAIYGDPILLLPKFYKPEVSVRWEVGIIPHIHDEDNPLIGNYLKEHSEATLISMQGYEKWEDLVLKICSCRFIVSSSLHGLIVSDAYGIPNVWVEFSDKVYGDGFKFRDYFASVNRSVETAVELRSIDDMESVMTKKSEYEPIHIDLNHLINSCPFNLPFK